MALMQPAHIDRPHSCGLEADFHDEWTRLRCKSPLRRNNSGSLSVGSRAVVGRGRPVARPLLLEILYTIADKI